MTDGQGFIPAFQNDRQRAIFDSFQAIFISFELGLSLIPIFTGDDRLAAAL